MKSMVTRLATYLLLAVFCPGLNAATVTLTSLYGDQDNFIENFLTDPPLLDRVVIALPSRMFGPGNGFLGDLVIPDNAGDIVGYELEIHLQLLEPADGVSFVYDNVFIGGFGPVGTSPVLLTFDLLDIDGFPVFPPSLLGSLNSGVHSLGISIFGTSDPIDRIKIDYISATVSYEMVVPVPAAAWLFATALLGLAGIGRRRRQSCHPTGMQVNS